MGIVNLLFSFFFKEEVYSLESSRQLLAKDIVQLHAPRYQCLRKVCNMSVPSQMSLPLVDLTLRYFHSIISIPLILRDH